MNKNLESQARAYCRNFPKTFNRAKNHLLFDETGNAYIDFLSGAGALNYGHNNDLIKEKVVAYLCRDGVTLSLDLYTTEKNKFMEAFHKDILVPRKLNYKLQFTSPSGTSVIESAVKLARKYTNRQNVITFTNAYHGVTLGSLSLTGSRYHRQSFMPGNVTRLPYDNYVEGFDSISYFKKLLEDPSSGLDIPAAVILETVQGEGGINVASTEWLQSLRKLTKQHNIILIIDDIQTGCGRTGTFFSFEKANIVPDMVCLSKSLSGLGLPFSLLLYQEEYDIWQPGEDNGTFRGNNLAFVSAYAAIKEYWVNSQFQQSLIPLAEMMDSELKKIRALFPDKITTIRGKGLMYGIVFADPEDAKNLSRKCFENKLIIERCGPYDEVLKLLPPLTITQQDFYHGISIIKKAVMDYYATTKKCAAA